MLRSSFFEFKAKHPITCYPTSTFYGFYWFEKHQIYQQLYSKTKLVQNGELTAYIETKQTSWQNSHVERQPENTVLLPLNESRW